MSCSNNKELDECVRKNVAWSDIPIYLKQVLNNTPREYDKFVVNFSLQNQLRFRGNLVRTVLRNEKRYYELLIEKSQHCLNIFPYHLADIVTKGLRITPFNYYLEIAALLLRTDRSYDTLPNFTAIDCLRVLGIGRNEYLALIAELKTNAPKLFRRPNPLAYLPRFPIEVNIEHWWKVEVGFVLENDIRNVSDAERALIDDLIDFGSLYAGQRDYAVIHSLYRKGLIYLDVPISGEDKICIPPLKNFVMNRVSGDWFENLLYQIFVSADEYTTIGELSKMIQIDLDAIKQAVSLFCRLGFAQKKTSFDVPNPHPSWAEMRQRKADEARPQVTPLNYHALLLDERGEGKEKSKNTTPEKGSVGASADEQGSSSELSDSYVVPAMENEMRLRTPPSPNRVAGGKRIAFLFDSTLTAFLMMGNLSAGLKNHAVTMFEVGKLSDESLDEFLGELEKVSLLDAEGEGEVSRYFAHAVFLRSTIIALRSVALSGLDLLRLECLEGLDKNIRDRLLATKYKCVISAAPLTSTFSNVLPIPFFGQFYRTSDNSNFWLKLFYYHLAGFGPPTLLLTKGYQLTQLPRMFLGYGSLLVTIVNTDSYVLNTNNFKSINKQLKNSCVLLQAYGLRSPGELRYESFPFDESEPDHLKFAQHRGIIRMKKLLNFTNTCGYVTFLKTGVKDIGCEEDVADVKLQRPQRRKTSAGKLSAQQQKKRKDLDIPVAITMTAANDNLATSPGEDRKDSVAELLSPNDDVDISTFQKKLLANEEHFATGTSPKSGSPANDYRSADCNELLQSELDTLTGRELISQASIEIPIGGDMDEDNAVVEEDLAEEWTILDVQFGVPLFDSDCNTRICESLAKRLLAEENLPLVNECNLEMNEKFMKFVHQCQYFEDEGMDLVKVGKLIPQPKYNLVFDYGKVNFWPGK